MLCRKYPTRLSFLCWLLTGYSKLNVSFRPTVNFIEETSIMRFRTDGKGPRYEQYSSFLLSCTRMASNRPWLRASNRFAWWTNLPTLFGYNMYLQMDNEIPSRENRKWINLAAVKLTTVQMLNCHFKKSYIKWRIACRKGLQWMSSLWLVCEIVHASVHWKFVMLQYSSLRTSWHLSYSLTTCGTYNIPFKRQSLPLAGKEARNLQILQTSIQSSKCAHYTGAQNLKQTVAQPCVFLCSL